ncbi:MAG TPA: phytanoyl-CoA dioxygenase family protein [Pyrinomonadaceae bacterium]|nr:phytanoyl-CoA dioxygenase family protein [Pyrinomonadaceae bacterium]
MNDWFEEIASGCELSERAGQELLDSGFAVIPSPVLSERLAQFSQAYDLAVADAVPPDLSVGGTTTRVHDLVNRGPMFDELYVHRPILEACCRVIGQPFKLSSLLARTVRPGSQPQPLHVDFRADDDGWPMVGFIFMVDDFRVDNGATRFVPGSHKWQTIPSEVMKDSSSEHEREVVVCGAAGSIILYNGSVWHGHTANQSGALRRSIQGAYIRREAEPWDNWAARMLPQTRARISPLAEYLLAV